MNRFVIADSSVCIGCRTCEAACAETHRQQGLQAKQEDAVVKADADLSAAEAALEKNPQDAAAQKAKTTAQAAKTAAQAERARIETIIAALKNGMVGGTALSGRSAAAVVQAATEGAARHVSGVQGTVKTLALKVLETDDTGALIARAEINMYFLKK